MTSSVSVQSDGVHSSVVGQPNLFGVPDDGAASRSSDDMSSVGVCQDQPTLSSSATSDTGQLFELSGSS